MLPSNIFYFNSCRHTNLEPEVHIRTKAIESPLGDVKKVFNSDVRAPIHDSSKTIEASIKKFEGKISQANKDTEKNIKTISGNPNIHNKRKGKLANKVQTSLEKLAFKAQKKFTKRWYSIAVKESQRYVLSYSAHSVIKELTETITKISNYRETLQDEKMKAKLDEAMNLLTSRKNNLDKEMKDINRKIRWKESVQESKNANREQRNIDAQNGSRYT